MPASDCARFVAASVNAAVARLIAARIAMQVAALGTALLLAGPAAAQPPPATAVATFAGGCFWSMELAFDKLDGVQETTSGYMGGTTRNPGYAEVSAGVTGHAEVVRVRYDPARVSYASLVDAYWRNIDPTVWDRQFCDIGSQYRSAIFVHDDLQRRIAEASRAALEKSKPFKEPIVTAVIAAGPFWPAEDEHQDYYIKNPIGYAHYRGGCGRDQRLASLWGKAAK